MKTVRIVLVAFVALALTACNTMHGFGKDVEKVGDKIQGASKK